MHEEACECELCNEYGVAEQDVALQKLALAVKLLQRADSEASPAERQELEFSEVVRIDAGLPQAIPAVMFHSPSRLQRLKAGFTYGYLLDNELEEIAESIREQMHQELAN